MKAVKSVNLKEQHTHAIKLKILSKYIIFLGPTSATKVLFSRRNIGFIGLISAGILYNKLKQKTKITLKISKSQKKKWKMAPKNSHAYSGILVQEKTFLDLQC